MCSPHFYGRIPGNRATTTGQDVACIAQHHRRQTDRHANARAEFYEHTASIVRRRRRRDASSIVRVARVVPRKPGKIHILVVFVSRVCFGGDRIHSISRPRAQCILILCVCLCVIVFSINMPNIIMISLSSCCCCCCAYRRRRPRAYSVRMCPRTCAHIQTRRRRTVHSGQMHSQPAWHNETLC